MQVFTARNPPTRYLLLTETRSIMFEFSGCLHLARSYETVDKVCTAKSVTFSSSGPNVHDKERKWAQETADLVENLIRKRNATLGLERIYANVAHALNHAQICNWAERRLCRDSTHQRWATDKPLVPGVSSYVIQRNNLVALDTDVVGCHGYYSDFSRTFYAGPDPPTDEGKELCGTALAQLNHNMSILRPGLTFREYTDLALGIPEQY
ncbi:hypothetical protein FGADI_8678 [Fusarium gaditjirri]|uniref:Peptidase M24 domain-containing protein n=1 Tax=Fusarium gaditjirri TaxID=282569 RepID=A0A8H4T1S3_9HYPO|nr:hypothetical protein FGADI_8678 [Fusarium gaditjirri]